MSKAQGDGFRTQTDHGLNAYRRRLDAKLSELRQATAKWYDRGDGLWVLAESWNVLDNPNGIWKWDGWRVVGRRYKIQVFEERHLGLDGDEPDVRGWSIVCESFDDRNEALAFLRYARETPEFDDSIRIVAVRID